MSKVGVVFKIYPRDGELERAADAVRTELKPASMQLEEVAFGIKLIKAFFKFDDTETSSSKIEESIKRISSVSEVEVEEESLL